MTNNFGIGVALITPFDKTGNVDYNALKSLVNRLIDCNVDYLVVLGTTSEYATLSPKEKEKVSETIFEANNNRKPIILGVGGYNTAEVVDEIKKVPSAVSTIMSVTPYYTKPSQAGLFSHFKEIALATDKPIILYNVPGRTSVNLNSDTTLKLANEFSNIVGIKEASGNFVQIMEIIRSKPDMFQVISGDDAITLPLISAGVTGVISVIGNLYPSAFGDIVRLSLENKFNEARKIQYELLPVMTAIFEDGSPAGIKEAMSVLKYCEKTVRKPLATVNSNTGNKIKSLIETIKHLN
jgi:4-hydroxy-tetrahydrodipicolinate synthase